MKLIIPMAGMGKRMRPHTLTTAKPLIPIAGKPIVEHLIEEIAKTVKENIDEIAFIVGHFGEEVENELKECATKIGAKASIYYQDQALGTAHAILCASPSLRGPLVIAFADTLFFSSFNLGSDKEAIIWTSKVENPSEFGVVLTGKDKRITEFVEKPTQFVSDLAMIGIYYFKDGVGLRSELQYLIDNNICKSGEYQLTDVLQNMMNKGVVFYSESVDQWLDCGNKSATIDTNAKVLQFKKDANFVHKTVKLENSVIISPCFIGEAVELKNSIVGPYVSIGANSIFTNAIIENSIVQTNVVVENIVLNHTMIGSNAKITRDVFSVSLSDFSEIDFK